MHIAGLDIGTTGCKIVVYDTSGNEIFSAYREYEGTGLSAFEADANEIWGCVKEIIAKAFKGVSNISAIGISTFGESFVLLDVNDAPLRPIMLYTHPSGEFESKKLAEKLGEKQIFDITGAAPQSMYTLPKLMWVRDNESEVFQNAAKVCTIQAFVTYLLTGNSQIDYSQAARTLAFDIHKCKWSDEVLTAVEIDQSLFPNPVPTGSSAGMIKESLLAEFEITDSAAANCQIVSCCHDQIAASIGAGVLKCGEAVDGAGTVQCLTPVFWDITNPENMLKSSFSVVPYIYPKTFCTYAFSFTGGALLKWFRDELIFDRYLALKEKGENIYKVLDSTVSHAPSELLILPHFAGAATPYMDSHSKGAILGLTLETTTDDVYKALMESVAFEMRLNKEKLEDSGIEIKSLHATGGGSASSVWLQMKADILRVPIVSLVNKEAGTVGSAMLAGVAVGAFPNLAEAAKSMVRYDKTYLPNEEISVLYDKIFERYLKLYDAVRPLV